MTAFWFEHKLCHWCGRAFSTNLEQKRFCSPRCCQRAWTHYKDYDKQLLWLAKKVRAK